MAVLTRKEEKDFIEDNYGCVLCKKYLLYNLWYGSSGEFANVDYCRRYVQIYLCCWINLFLLQHFCIPLNTFLYRSPYFLKFVDSGFLNYLDYTFLAAFARESFSFDAEGKQRIRGFVEAYFECFIEEALERDLLDLVGKVLNGILLEALGGHLTKTLGSSDEFLLDRQARSKLLTKGNKWVIFRLGLHFSQPFLQGGYYRAYRPIQPYSGRSMKSSFSLIRDREMESLEAHLKPAKLIRSIMDKSLIGLLDSWYQEEVVLNQEIHSLIDSSESEGEEAHIGLHKNLVAEAGSIEEGLIPEDCLIRIAKGHKAYFKSIDNSLVESGGEKTIDPKPPIDCEIDFLFIEETESLLLEDQEECVIEQNTLSDIRYDDLDENKEDEDFLFWAFYRDIYLKSRKTKAQKATNEYFLVPYEGDSESLAESLSLLDPS